MEGDSTGPAAVSGEGEHEDDGEVAPWLVVDDETETELSELLDSSETVQPVKLRFADDPYSMPVVVQSSSAYVTINGNEESCGSSFSDSYSSVMASVDVGGGGGMRGGAWECGCGVARGLRTEGSLEEGDVDLDFGGLGGFLTDGEDAMWAEFLDEVFK
ncbi:Unknown protein [Striga hermonthica]|uniref:Uncharacterized protein n=1 Tax=Striga hermonthica TaxID=68872 RepID=A0A9N7MSQ5_STRHE|nr:Unknown protein [Striga hermonthica]